jgi:hypothetical protein
MVDRRVCRSSHTKINTHVGGRSQQIKTSSPVFAPHLVPSSL